MSVKRKSDLISDDESVDENPPQEVIAQETPPEDVFLPPSVVSSLLLDGGSYTHHSSIPEIVAKDLSEPCVLGVDEAGRGPVLGPMVYGLAYLPLAQHRSLLADKYRFDDSKVLTPEFRSSLLQQWCDQSTDLHRSVGWCVRLLSARDIGAGMLRPKDFAGYNLNQQAMDATVSLIQETMDKGINVAEIYIDTIGKPEIYQSKLERIFPTAKITVAKKADSLYPCVSAASVAAKVTRDAALEVMWRDLHGSKSTGPALVTEQDSLASSKKSSVQKKGRKTEPSSHASQGWGSGYPSDARCSSWLKDSMHPVFGWGLECRFSWGTAKDLVEEKGKVRVAWPEPEDEDAHLQISKFFHGSGAAAAEMATVDDSDGLLDETWKSLGGWYGKSVAAAPAS